MKGFFDFRAFEASCMHLDKALAMVTADNCKATDDLYNNNDTIIDNFMWYGKDDAKFVKELMKRGCLFSFKSLGYASERKKKESARYLLSINPELLWECQTRIIRNILELDVECMKISVEHALCSGYDNLPFSEEAYDYIQHRNSMRSCAIHTMHAMCEMGRKDVGRIIARVIWSLRSATF